MASRFPLLEQMRAARERREVEASAPVREQLSACQIRAAELRQALDGLERFIASEVSKYVIERSADDLWREVRKVIWEAVAKSHPGKPVVMTFDPETLRFTNPQAIESEVLRRYSAQAIPSLRVRAGAQIEDSVTVVDFRIPAIGVRHAMQTNG